jgi:hypothetical protein
MDFHYPVWFFQGVRVDTLDIPPKMIITGGCSVMGTSYLYIAVNVGFYIDCHVSLPEAIFNW